MVDGREVIPDADGGGFNHFGHGMPGPCTRNESHGQLSLAHSGSRGTRNHRYRSRRDRRKPLRCTETFHAIGGDNVKWVVGADGSNGADRALLEAIDPRRVARRYDELVIMSGDHAFADLAHHANGLGLQVHVVTTRRGDGSSSLSR